MIKPLSKAILIGILGALIGGSVIYVAMAKYMNKGQELMDASAITSTIETLKTLRGGDTKHGYDLLETHLDQSIIMFSLPPQTKEGLTAIEAAKSYRQQYPFKESDTNVDNAINEVLSR